MKIINSVDDIQWCLKTYRHIPLSTSLPFHGKGSEVWTSIGSTDTSKCEIGGV